MNLKITAWGILPAALVVMLSSSKMDPNNPPTGRTGAPGETTCQASGCHSGGSFTGTVTITGVPDSVVADSTYAITLTNSSNASKAGFQLTVLDESNTKTGTLTAGTGCSIGNSGGRQYVRQSTPKNISNGSASWTFNWKAPSAVANDSIHFYFVSLCANGNGNDNGDNVLKSSKTVVMPPPVSAVKNAKVQLGFSIFPNPVEQTLNMDLIGEKNITIMDGNGKVAMTRPSFSSTKLDVSSFNPGLYFIKVNQKGQFGTQVFVKK